MSCTHIGLLHAVTGRVWFSSRGEHENTDGPIKSRHTGEQLVHTTHRTFSKCQRETRYLLESLTILR
jgi:hypothetical protein